MKKKTNWSVLSVLGDVRAGEPEYHPDEKLDEIEVNIGQYKREDCFGLRIKGDSMAPRMLEGDIVIVHKQRQSDNGDIVVVCVDNENATVKKLVKDNSKVEFRPLNEKYKPIRFSDEEGSWYNVQIIGKVIELISKM